MESDGEFERHRLRFRVGLESEDLSLYCLRDGQDLGSVMSCQQGPLGCESLGSIKNIQRGELRWLRDLN